MLTVRQHELLTFINQRIRETGVSPSFDEMKVALGQGSKSGIHRLVSALEERGFIRRLANRARALEIVKLPDTIDNRIVARREGAPSAALPVPANDRGIQVQVMGRIAAGSPIEAIQTASHTIVVPPEMIGGGEHYALEVRGDSMIEAGILDGDTILVHRQDTASNGEIVVALVDGEEATLKRLRRKGGTIALEAANPAYETRVLPEERVSVQGRMVGLLRRY